MPEAQTARHQPDANPPSFESVWAMMQENAVQMKELRESQKETDRVLKESKKALDIQIGSLTNLFGDLTLGMVAPRLREKFRELGLVFLETDDVKDLALQEGLYIIEPDGENFNITPPNDKPKEW